MNLSRRTFMLCSGAFCTSLAFGTGVAAQGPRRLRLGVVSDLHICGGIKAFSPETVRKNCETTRKALKWFDAQGVDAVVVPGDIADLARVEELQAFADTWNEVFPNGKGADGRPVEKLFIYGNHESYPQEAESRGSKAIWTEGRDKVWERVFGEPFQDLRVKTVKGYDFILGSWLWEAERLSIGGGFKRFQELVAASAAKKRPFFFVQHMHPAGTCHGPYACGRDDGRVTALLQKYHNAIVFSGHSHYLLTDERTVWQGGFTSIGCGSLNYSGEPNEDYAPFGFENSNADWATNTHFAPGVRKAVDREKIMPRLNRGHQQLARGRQGMLVDVFDDGLVVRRHEFVYDCDLGADWRVPLPARAGGPFDPKVRAGATPRCEFPSGAALVVGPVRKAASRDYIMHDVIPLTVPAGAVTTGAPLVGYAVGYRDEKGVDCHLQYVCAFDFNLPQPQKDKTMEILVRADRVPPKARLTVRPLDCFQRPGKELSL